MTTARTMTRSMGWPAGAAPRDYVLGGVRAVLADSVVDNARVVVRDGLIAEVATAPAGSAADLDGGGLLCVPGLIDVHSDALEKERAPRPGVHLPWDFGVTSLEGKLSAAGITTAFHGAGFQDKLAGHLAGGPRHLPRHLSRTPEINRQTPLFAEMWVQDRLGAPDYAGRRKV